jgi:sugar lactone lactonase YvrE
VLTIDPKHRIVEGVASDGRTIWISSVLDRQILACTKNCRLLTTLPQGLYPFAITWDSKRSRLWVAADCPPGVPGITPCESGALIGLDRSGKIRTRIFPDDDSFHPGDVSVSDGRVFVSDSQNGAVYQLPPTASDLTTLLAPHPGGSAQGTALAADGRTLVAADYGQGIASLNVATGTRKILQQADSKPVRGVDGLARCGETYFGVYNGGAIPARVYAIRIGSRSIERSDLLELPMIADPTQIAFDGKRLLAVSDSGWERLEKKEVARSTGARIVAVPLSASCQPK